MKTAKQILIEGLKAMSADGLCYPDMDCGCSVADLCPIEGCINLDECRPARWIAPDSPDADQEMLEDFPDGYFVLVEEPGIPFDGGIDGAMRAAVAEVERRRSENYRLSTPNAVDDWGNPLVLSVSGGTYKEDVITANDARIKELEADRIEARAQYLLFMNDNPGCIAWNFDELDETEQDALREQARHMLELEEPWAYVQLREARELIKRLEAAFLESEAENQFHQDYGESDWEIHPDEEFDDHHGRNWYREEAREALERIKELEAEVDGMDENLVRGGDEGCPKHV